MSIYQGVLLIIHPAELGNSTVSISEIRAQIKKEYTLVRFVMIQPETVQD